MSHVYTDSSVNKVKNIISMENYYIGGIILVLLLLFYVVVKSQEGLSIPPPPYGYTYIYNSDGTVARMVHGSDDILPVFRNAAREVIAGPTPPDCCYYIFEFNTEAPSWLGIKNMVHKKTGKIMKMH